MMTAFGVNIDPSAIFANYSQYGLLGIMLYWFAVRFERRLEKHSDVISALSRSILLDVLSRPNLSPRVKEEVHELLEKVGRIPLSAVTKE